MSYRQDLATAARRYLKAAHLLYESELAGAQPGCMAVAGYLFGLAGELALKQMMRAAGMRPLSEAERREDPFYAHFPELKTYLIRADQSRRYGELRRLVEDSRLFQYWHTNMRYAPTADIKAEWVLNWKVCAERVVERMS